MTTRPLPRPPSSDPPPDVRLRDPAGVVSAVPYLLGFAPRHSLVVVGLDPDRSVGPTLRCDWQPGRPPGATRPLWRHLSAVARRNGCTSALALVYVDVDPDQLPAGWDDDLVDALLGRQDLLDRHEPDEPEALDVVDLLAVGPQRFRSLLCRDATCCPAQGTPVSRAESHPVAAGFVLAGRSPAADRAALVPEGAVSDSDRRTALLAARAAGTVDRTSPAPGSDPDTDDRELLRLWSAGLPDGPDPELAGRLAAAWRTRPRLRDACLAVLLPGGERGAHAVLAPVGGSAAAQLGESLADPACSRSTQVGTPVLRRLAALTTGPEQATVLAAHSWLCWVAGEGTAAAVLAERSLQVDARQSLARLVLQCLQHGLGAPWTTAAVRTRPHGRPWTW